MLPCMLDTNAVPAVSTRRQSWPQSRRPAPSGGDEQSLGPCSIRATLIRYDRQRCETSRPLPGRSRHRDLGLPKETGAVVEEQKDVQGHPVVHRVDRTDLDPSLRRRPRLRTRRRLRHVRREGREGRRGDRGHRPDRRDLHDEQGSDPRARRRRGELRAAVSRLRRHGSDPPLGEEHRHAHRVRVPGGARARRGGAARGRVSGRWHLAPRRGHPPRVRRRPRRAHLLPAHDAHRPGHRHRDRLSARSTRPTR